MPHMIAYTTVPVILEMTVQGTLTMEKDRVQHAVVEPTIKGLHCARFLVEFPQAKNKLSIASGLSY